LCSTKIHAKTQFELSAKIHKLAEETREMLSNASHLIITFGTSWGYELIDEQFIVANCHKQVPTRFKKELTPLNELHNTWVEIIKQLQAHFPQLQLIFTISPVRHIRDGIVENNRSKARLFELINLLEQEKNCFYFPSYEIVNDELRDYRFFNADMVHPSPQAIAYVWDCFKKSWIQEESQQIGKEIHAFKRFEAHKIDGENEETAIQHQLKIEQEKQRLSTLYPFIKL
jgi:hypothetical protein